MKIEVNIDNNHLVALIVILLVVGAVGYVESYGTNNPPVMGHTWSEIDQMPAGFADDVDDGFTTLADLQTAVSNDFHNLGGTDLKCDVSGVCSQICIGTACQSSWPSTTLRAKTIEIGTWNMDSTPSVDVTHDLDYKKVRIIYVMIRNDDDTSINPLDIQGNGWWGIGVTNTEVTLRRLNGGFFDGSANYDGARFNRGFVTIWYEM